MISHDFTGRCAILIHHIHPQTVTFLQNRRWPTSASPLTRLWSRRSPPTPRCFLRGKPVVARESQRGERCERCERCERRRVCFGVNSGGRRVGVGGLAGLHVLRGVFFLNGGSKVGVSLSLSLPGISATRHPPPATAWWVSGRGLHERDQQAEAPPRRLADGRRSRKDQGACQGAGGGPPAGDGRWRPACG